MSITKEAINTELNLSLYDALTSLTLDEEYDFYYFGDYRLSVWHGQRGGAGLSPITYTFIQVWDDPNDKEYYRGDIQNEYELKRDVAELISQIDKERRP